MIGGEGLEYFRFTGDSSEANVAVFLKYIDSHPLFKETFVPPQKFLEVVGHMKLSIDLFGRDNGFDLGKRLPYLDRLVFVSQAEMIQIFGTSLNPRAIFNSTDNFKIYVAIDDLDGKNRAWGSVAHSVNHEFLHCIAFHEVFINRRDETFETVRSGMLRKEKYFFLNEALCELTNLYVMNRYWRKIEATRSIIDESTAECAVPEGVSLLYGLIAKLGSETGRGFVEILRIAHEDLLTGADLFLDMCTERWGEGLIEILSRPMAETRFDYDSNRTLDWARKFELTELEKRVEKDLSNGTRENLTSLSRIGIMVS